MALLTTLWTQELNKTLIWLAQNLEEFLAPAALGLSEYPSNYQLEIKVGWYAHALLMRETLNFQQWTQNGRVLPTVKTWKIPSFGLRGKGRYSWPD